MVDSKIDDFIVNHNYIGNLQLHKEIPNIEKKTMDFDEAMILTTLIYFLKNLKLLIEKLNSELRK